MTFHLICAQHDGDRISGSEFTNYTDAATAVALLSDFVDGITIHSEESGCIHDGSQGGRDNTGAPWRIARRYGYNPPNADEHDATEYTYRTGGDDLLANTVACMSDDAEQWLDTIADDNHAYGWSDMSFHYETLQWWEANR